MAIFAKFYDDFPLPIWPEAPLFSTKQKWMQTLWSRDSAFLKKVQDYADEKLVSYNQTAPHEVSRCSIEMRDGLKVRGVRFIHPEYTSEMIIFGGLQQYCEYFVERAWKYHQLFTSNVLTFDLRGTHQEHIQEPTEEAIIQDGVELVKKTMKERNVPSSSITLYGTSLGGAIATIAAARLSREGIEVTVVNERSFRNLGSVMKSLCPGLGHFGAYRASNEGWIFDVEEAIKELKGRFIVIYHPNDYYIHTKASLRQALLDNPPTHIEPKVIEMKDDGTCCSDFEKELSALTLHFVRGHNRNLNTQELQQLCMHLNAKDRALVVCKEGFSGNF